MCGIAGLYCLDRACSGDDHQLLVARMCDLQTHRGPDDRGVIGMDHVSLGACRLSIIDLSPAGHMPMSDAAGRWWITYNGEVYNFREIRDDLQRLGRTFRSQTDTEVVLHSYIEWGERCIDHFVGMFAFAIYDRETGRLVLGRDRYGVKPLYYAQSGAHLLVASESKALARTMQRASVDHRRLTEWFLYRHVDSQSPGTLFEGISSVLPGHFLTITREGIETKEVYRITSHVSEREFRRFAAASRTELIDEFDNALNDSTRLRLVSDVPVGTLLSGGLDSSLVTALAAQHTRDLTAFNVSVAGFPDLDEKRFAQALTCRLGLPLVSFELTPEGFRRELPQAVYLSDHPLTYPNSIAYFLISRVAREHGVIVLLSGEGADELFGGYVRYRRKRRLLRLAPLFDHLPEGFWKILEVLTYARRGMSVTIPGFRELLPAMVSLVDRYERAAWQAQCEEAYSFISDPTDRAILGSLLADLNGLLTPLLRRLDRMTMGNSVECRVPYLDHRITQKAINLPLVYRVGRRSGKWLLRQVAARYIPERLAQRKKLGFPLPLVEYVAPLVNPDLFAAGFCREELGLHARGLKELLDGWRHRPRAFFSLLTLEIWGRLFIRGETVEDIRERIIECERGRASGARSAPLVAARAG